MYLYIDTREQQSLAPEFPKMEAVTIIQKALPVGDYGAGHLVKGVVQEDGAIIERKSVPDLFTSFTGERYEAERDKVLRAKALGLKYILAIESSFTELLKGHAYWKDGELHESRKTGIAMIRQLCTMSRKYGMDVWFCTSRREMAMRIQEYFISYERVKPDEELVPMVAGHVSHA